MGEETWLVIQSTFPPHCVFVLYMEKDKIGSTQKLGAGGCVETSQA